jgi:hypothetical protein
VPSWQVITGEALAPPLPRNPQPGDLAGVPWAFAFECRRRGWYLRGEQIWCKSNPIPDGSRSRPGRQHEHVFLLTRFAGSSKHWRGRKGGPRLLCCSAEQRRRTPPAFAEWLVGLARTAIAPGVAPA